MYTSTIFHKKGQRFSIEGKTYEFNRDVKVIDKDGKRYIDGKETNLIEYATYIEPFDEESWKKEMAKKGFHFHGSVGVIFW